MQVEKFRSLIQKIVKEANDLKNKHTSETKAKVNYACIFCQNEQEFSDFNKLTSQLGETIEETQSGPLFKITSLNTISGKLQLLKIRLPDKTRQERGDADFTVLDYISFKEKHLDKKGFSLIKRKNFEMIELADPEFNVRAYFSNPPLDKQLNLKL